MRKRIFMLEWPDSYKPDWLNEKSVKECLVSTQHVLIKDVIVTDVTIPLEKAVPTKGGFDY